MREEEPLQRHRLEIGLAAPGTDGVPRFRSKGPERNAWIVCVCLFVPEFAVQVVVLILSLTSWHDPYNAYLFSIPFIPSLCAFFFAIGRYLYWSYDEFSPFTIFSPATLVNVIRPPRVVNSNGEGGANREPRRPVSTWVTISLFTSLISAIGFMRPLMIYASIHGREGLTGQGTPVCQSSCQKHHLEGAFFNPNGWFDLVQKGTDFAFYDDTGTTPYMFCTLFARWGGSVPPVVFKEESPVVWGFIDPADPSLGFNNQNGFASPYIANTAAYPNGGYGMPDIVSDLSRVRITDAKLCPGVTDVPPTQQDLTDCGRSGSYTDAKVGRGGYIPTACLGYYRSMGSDGTAGTGPPGYEAFVTTSRAPQNPFCYFCPGLGRGPFGYMGWRPGITESQNGGSCIMVDLDGVPGEICFSSITQVVDEEFALLLTLVLFPWVRNLILSLFWSLSLRYGRAERLRLFLRQSHAE